jgi:hypothetical protein
MRENRPHKLQSWTASELGKLPTYYVMGLDKGMAETGGAGPLETHLQPQLAARSDLTQTLPREPRRR